MLKRNWITAELVFENLLYPEKKKVQYLCNNYILVDVFQFGIALHVRQ